MAKTTFLPLLIAASLLIFARTEPLVTQARIDYLRRHVSSYQVTNYAENIFKGWTVEEARAELVSSSDIQSENPVPLPAYKGLSSEYVPSALDWREKAASCILPVGTQHSCGSAWAFTLTHMLGERV